MTMNAPNTWIALNQAPNGFGGGIYLTNGATANIGSPGYLSGGAIYDNEALNGGGIASVGARRCGCIQPIRCIRSRLTNNTAYQDGGGIYIVNSGSSGSEFCAANFRITNNIAKEGSALLTDDDESASGRTLLSTPKPTQTRSTNAITPHTAA